jgi:hypothetical protein
MKRPKLNNYYLFKLFVQQLLQKSYTDQEIKTIGEEILKNVKNLVWTIILVNTPSEDLQSLKSNDQKTVRRGIDRILAKGLTNQQTMEEVKTTLQKVLVNLNQESASERV